MSLALYLNVLVVVLLVPTLIYSVLLNRRLAALRSNRAELEALIQSFNDSCTRAESGVRTLRTATDEATRLQQYLERSQSLRDDLSYLLDRGTGLADRLEGGVRSARTETRGAEAKARPTVVSDVADASTMRAANRFAERVAEREDASVDASAPVPRSERPARGERPARDRTALRQALAGAASAGAAGGAEAGGVRSKAERELLQALRAKR